MSAIDPRLISPLEGGPKDGRDPWLAPTDRAEGGSPRDLAQSPPSVGVADISPTRVEITSGATPVRLRLSRKAGFNLQDHSRAVNGLPAVHVARPGKWGNPHVALRTWYHQGIAGRPPFDAVTAADADREGAAIAVALFRRVWETSLKGASSHSCQAALAELRGKNLACWCKPGAPCHADVLLELANPGWKPPVCERAEP